MLDDDPLITYLKAYQFEWRDSDEGTLIVYEIDVWIGGDLEKIMTKAVWRARRNRNRKPNH